MLRPKSQPHTIFWSGFSTFVRLGRKQFKLLSMSFHLCTTLASMDLDINVIALLALLSQIVRLLMLEDGYGIQFYHETVEFFASGIFSITFLKYNHAASALVKTQKCRH